MGLKTKVNPYYYIPKKYAQLCHLAYVMNCLSNVYDISYVQLITIDTSERTYSKLIYMYYIYYVTLSTLIRIE